ncbi:hypothetical protein [Sandaracinus amylolyticus]|uniref:hypothetical protein n=1 Tax=Sandaracinus amylolyticus TaxID=927083 RepID=UPI001F290F7C|nr:hypothetical protein [Sandaracinus amylolyticus]UJR84880.1 Hypothetical protein I5071_69590 [Sandaracinus amylolyticus]
MRREKMGPVVVALALLALAPCVARAQDVPSAGSVLFAIDQGVDDDRAIALRAELGLRALHLELVPALAGESDAAREQQARLLAQHRAAYATLWIDDARNEARAVTPAGPMRRASLPRTAGTIDPRVLAVLLGSLLDEALAMPGPEEAAPVLPVAPSTAPPPAEPQGAYQPSSTVVIVPEELDAPDPGHDTRDGDVHPYAIVDFSVGAVWSLGEQANIAHFVQRAGAGLLVDQLRVEITLGMGADKAMDGGYLAAFTIDGQAFVGTSLPLGFAALDLGGIIGGVGHEFIDAHTLSDFGMMTAMRVGGAIGLNMRDSRAIFPFRARIEMGLFARFEYPGRAAPFTNVVLGIAFW